jgi:predicted nucleotidyltransferase
MSIVTPILSEQLEAIRRICRLRNVLRLEVFGSAVSDRFDMERSDLDLLVEFAPLPPTDHADAYFGLLEDLQDLLQRDVDLVEAQAIDNPYFKRTVDAQRKVLYAT